MEDVDLVAVCDVWDPNLQSAIALSNGRAEGYRDFREVLAREDVDAVLIATPDHWHSIPTIHALEAGKDVYVEKPLSLTIAEGRRMVEASQKTDRIVQVGLQQRSGTHFQSAIERIRRGDIGQITKVETWYNENHSPNGIGITTDSEPPQGLDWNAWLGPAPNRPYNHNRRVHFRWFWDHSGGKVTDWGTHLMDIVQAAMGVEYPNAVMATGSKYLLKDNRETPDTIHVLWEYPEFLASFSNRVCNRYEGGDGYYGISFFGTEGTLFLNREGWKITPERYADFPGQEGYDKLRMESSESVGSPQHEPHCREFIDCVKSRQQPIGDIKSAHRSTSACVIANIAYRTKRRLEWNGQAERFVGDDLANEFLDYEYRGGWWA
ncbi:MAG: Gfo/Idh/MocA family oxidoreductase [Candidatus Omnitrophica bacterium]|nr:Gfo/Idh/MocA family oxidoreductase [Candidatus Omnitrophota bacterium]MCA9428581.1 Gfo/Idh/MocA family oxidoreductase [Candidatus Omnitrophota bacterium]